MSFSGVEAVADNSLGITFECPKCAVAVAMVTNAGETQMVSALGVTLGGRDEAPAAFEQTRGSLDHGAPVEAAVKASAGKCPFANTMAAKQDATREAKKFVVEDIVAWTENASVRLQNVPEGIRPIARQLIEGMARELGRDTVDDDMMDQARDRFM